MPATSTVHHITDFHFERYNEQRRSRPLLTCPPLWKRYVRPADGDIEDAIEGLKALDVNLARPICAIHPGAGVAWKQWHITNFIKVAKCLTDDGWNVLWIHGPEIKENCDIEAVTELLARKKGIANWPHSRLVGLFAGIDAYIGNDSGMTHLAAAVGCRTLSIFGPTNEYLYWPLGPRVNVYRASPESFTKESQSDICQLMNTFQTLKMLAGEAYTPDTRGSSSTPGTGESKPA
jgi:ADP-heptose:LPS heptosyltransferase